HQMGLDQEIPKGPAIALGAVDASLVDMVTVYATLANRGYRPTHLHYLDRIETRTGEVLYEQERPSRRDFAKVLEPGHADMMLNLLQSVVDSGTANRLRRTFKISGPFYAKTGTTQDQADGWMLGFNPELVTGVWVGADHPGIHFRTLSRGQAARTALPVFGSYTLRVFQDRKFRKIRDAVYPQPPEMVQALMECPPYLEQMPIMDYADQSVDDMIAWNQFIESLPPLLLQQLLDQHPQRATESSGAYARRLARIAERSLRRDERREERKEFWGNILFGKKQQGPE
ncbi:MAG: penicillin-binding transpeptidase domain-containing protein, partial [Bacteroidota bacterium]